jgi:NAD(P)-dependent dehydrogenase (short-subunit alcohol dehydrogenase family)
LICWSRSEGDLDTLQDEVTTTGARCTIRTVDVGDPKLVAAAVEQMGGRPLDAVVVNAGEGVWTPFDEYTYEQWRLELASNLDGAFNTISRTVGLLLKSHSKSLVAIGSDSCLYPFARRAAYAASKTATCSLLETVALTLLPQIRLRTWCRSSSV